MFPQFKEWVGRLSFAWGASPGQTLLLESGGALSIADDVAERAVDRGQVGPGLTPALATAPCQTSGNVLLPAFLPIRPPVNLLIPEAVQFWMRPFHAFNPNALSRRFLSSMSIFLSSTAFGKSAPFNSASRP